MLLPNHINYFSGNTNCKNDRIKNHKKNNPPKYYTCIEWGISIPCSYWCYLNYLITIRTNSKTPWFSFVLGSKVNICVTEHVSAIRTETYIKTLANFLFFHKLILWLSAYLWVIYCIYTFFFINYWSI